MLLSPALTVLYHVVVAAFGHLWMLYYARRLPLPLFLLSASVNLALLVAEHAQPLLDVLSVGDRGADGTSPLLAIPGAAWLQQQSTALHLAQLVPAGAFCFLMYKQVDVIRATAGFAVLVLSDFVGLTVVAHPPPAYDCVAMVEAFQAPGGWVAYLCHFLAHVVAFAAMDWMDTCMKLMAKAEKGT